MLVCDRTKGMSQVVASGDLRGLDGRGVGEVGGNGEG